MNGGGELFWVGFENCLTDLLLQIPNRNMWGEWAEMDRTGLGGNDRDLLVKTQGNTMDT